MRFAYLHDTIDGAAESVLRLTNHLNPSRASAFVYPYSYSFEGTTVAVHWIIHFADTLYLTYTPTDALCCVYTYLRPDYLAVA